MENPEPKVFQLIDLDRTLFDTVAYVDAIAEQVNAIEPGYGTELEERLNAAYERGLTFPLLRILRDEKGSSEFEAMVHEAVRKVGAASLAMAGMEDRLALAETIGGAKYKWGILTYGDARDQRMKSAFIGLDRAPMYITDSPNKGALIRSWQQEDGTFQLPGELGGQVVDELTFEDDKIEAFENLPEGVTSFWVTSRSDAPSTLATLQEKGEVGHVTIVEGLPDITAQLRKQYPRN